MSSNTPNLSLILPEQTDYYNSGVHYDNYSTLDEVVGDVTQQLEQIVVNVEQFGARPTNETGFEDFDSTQAIQDAINYLRGKNGKILFPGLSYKANALLIKDISNVELDGNHTVLYYNGNKDVDIQGANNSHLFKIENSSVVLRNFKFVGRLFYGLDKNNLPINPILNSEYVTDAHRAVFSTGSNIVIKNCEAVEFNTCFRIQNSVAFLENCIAKDCRSSFDALSGSVNFVDKTVIFKDCKSFDARFNFVDIPTGGVSTIGSGGTAFLYEGINVELHDCEAYRAGTNTFRANANTKAFLKNCKSYQARRHGFSVYNSNSYVKYYDCLAVDTADAGFWNGTNTTNNFRRPHNTTSPVPFVITDTDNTVSLKRCITTGKAYEDGVLPVNTNEVLNAVVPYNLFKIYNGNTNQVEVYDCDFIGYSLSDAIDTSNCTVIFKNNKVKARKATNNTSYRAFFNSGEGSIIDGSEFIGGRDGLVVSSKNHIIKNNIIQLAGRHGLQVLSDNAFVDGNTIKNTAQNEVGYGIVISNPNVTFGNNLVVDDQTVKTMAFALRLDGAATGFIPGNVVSKGITNKVSRQVAISNDDSPIYGKATSQSNSNATDVETLKTDLNALLTRLKNAGLMA